MNRLISILIFSLLVLGTTAQVYVLKDHRDSIGEQEYFDTVPNLADSFFAKMRFHDVRVIKNFTPSFKHLKSTFDTMDVEYNQADVLLKQQIIQKKLERRYGKVLKKAKRQKIRFKKFNKQKTEYSYGKSKEGYEFCYVTITCKRNRKDLTVKFLAIKLNGYWFIGDELKIYWL